jgi:hypothetical protein
MPRSICVTVGFDRGDDFRRIVFQVVHAGGLTAAPVGAIAKGDDHEVLPLEHKPRDAKWGGQLHRLHGNGKLQAHQ